MDIWEDGIMPTIVEIIGVTFENTISGIDSDPQRYVILVISLLLFSLKSGLSPLWIVYFSHIHA